MDEMYKLDVDNTARQKSEFVASKALEEEQIKLSRAHQVEEINFEKESLGIQAAAAKSAADYAKDMIPIETAMAKTLGYAQAHPEIMLNAFSNAMEAAGKVKLDSLNGIKDTIDKMNNLHSSVPKDVADIVDALNRISKIPASSLLMQLLKYLVP
jgi:hypothetical protein